MNVNEAAREVVRLLKEKGLHVVVMESCTGGALTSALTDVPGASDVLMESHVTYSNEAKIARGVPQSVIEEHGVYSLDCAVAMAEAAMYCSLADKERTIGIGVTGRLDREDPANPGSPTGTVYVFVRAWGGGYNSATVTTSEDNRHAAKAEIVFQTLALVVLPFLRGDKHAGGC